MSLAAPCLAGFCVLSLAFSHRTRVAGWLTPKFTACMLPAGGKNAFLIAPTHPFRPLPLSFKCISQAFAAREALPESS